MLYLYRILPDETVVMYSQLLNDGSQIVHLERPTERGFDSARCTLPGVQWLYQEGYSRFEISAFETMLFREQKKLLVLGQAMADGQTLVE